MPAPSGSAAVGRLPAFVIRVFVRPIRCTSRCATSRLPHPPPRSCCRAAGESSGGAGLGPPERAARQDARIVCRRDVVQRFLLAEALSKPVHVLEKLLFVVFARAGHLRGRTAADADRSLPCVVEGVGGARVQRQKSPFVQPQDRGDVVRTSAHNVSFEPENWNALYHAARSCRTAPSSEQQLESNSKQNNNNLDDPSTYS